MSWMFFCQRAVSSLLFWSSVVSIPVILTYRDLYRTILPNPPSNPVGLILGITSVMVGHSFTVMYFYLYFEKHEVVPIQSKGFQKYIFRDALQKHIFQPEGFILLIGYLGFSWSGGFMPESYYSFDGGIQWVRVAHLLFAQDFIQFCIHYFEHKSHLSSHQPHHRFMNPKIFDAFNGSPVDTVVMIIIPLIISSRLVSANIWSYITFGTIYANWLTLIHSEYSHPWDSVFKAIGFGTPSDHHMHHRYFHCNYGHMFMYWDKLFGTYRR